MYDRKLRWGSMLLLSIWVSVLVASVGIAGVRVPGRYAIVIGNAKYQKLVDLKFPVADAQAMAAVLAESSFQVQKLTNATYSQLSKAFDKLAEVLAQEREDFPKLEPEVVIYYSGHGVTVVQEKGDFLGAITPVDMKPSAMEPRVDEIQFNDWLSRLGSAKVTVILDCGSMGANSLSAPGRQILAASKEDENAMEFSTISHGVFTYFLLDGLTKGNADGEGKVSLQKAFQYARAQVQKVTEGHQHPQISGELESFPRFYTTKVQKVLGATDPYEARQLWAVLIGISDYKDPEITDLSYAHNDAQLLHDWLVEEAQLSEEHIRLLLNEEATLTGIRNSLYWLIEVSKPGDLVLLYFSGHGNSGIDHSGDESDGFDEFIVPYDAASNFMEYTCLSDDELDHILRHLQPQVYLQRRTVITILDCGPMGAKELAAPGRLIITGSREEECPWEDDELQHGVFTYYLLQGLLEGNAGSDEFVSLQKAFRYAQKEVEEFIRKKHSVEQIPQMDDQVGRDVYFQISIRLLPLLELPGRARIK